MLDRKEKKMKKILEKQKNGTYKPSTRKKNNQKMNVIDVTSKTNTNIKLIQQNRISEEKFINFSPVPEVYFNIDDIPAPEVIDSQWPCLDIPHTDLFVDLL